MLLARKYYKQVVYPDDSSMNLDVSSGISLDIHPMQVKISKALLELTV